MHPLTTAVRLITLIKTLGPVFEVVRSTAVPRTAVFNSAVRSFIVLPASAWNCCGTNSILVIKVRSTSYEASYCRGRRAIRSRICSTGKKKKKKEKKSPCVRFSISSGRAKRGREGAAVKASSCLMYRRNPPLCRRRRHRARRSNYWVTPRPRISRPREALRKWQAWREGSALEY